MGLHPLPAWEGEGSPSMGLFYHADARSAGERALGFASRPCELVSPGNYVRYRAGIQMARGIGRSNAPIMGGPGCTGANSRERRKGAAPPWIASRPCKLVAPGNYVRYRAGIPLRLDLPPASVPRMPSIPARKRHVGYPQNRRPLRSTSFSQEKNKNPVLRFPIPLIES